MADKNRRRFLNHISSTTIAGSLFGTIGTISAEDNTNQSDHANGCEKSDRDVPPSPPGKGADDWPSYRRDSGNSGYVPGEPNIDGESLEVDWEYDYSGSPVVSDQTLYLVTGDSVHALDVRDGSQMWVTDGLGSVSTPTVAYDTIYVGGDSLIALDASDGSVCWERDVDTDKIEPTVQYERIYAVIDEEVVAFDAHDGTVDWTLEELEQCPCRGPLLGRYDRCPFEEIPVPAANGLVFAAANMYTFGLDAKTGEIVWEGTDDVISPTNMIASDDFIVQYENIYANVRDAETGEVLSRAGSSHWPEAVDDKYVYGPYYYHLRAWDAKTGETNWQTDYEPIGMGTPSVTEETVFISFNRGHSNPRRKGSLVAFDKETGEEKWVFPKGEDGPTVGYSSVISGNTIYTHLDGKLVALRSQGKGRPF